MTKTPEIEAADQALDAWNDAAWRARVAADELEAAQTALELAQARAHACVVAEEAAANAYSGAVERAALAGGRRT